MPLPPVDGEDLPVGEVVRRKQAFWKSISIEYLRTIGRHTNALDFHRVLDVHKIGLCDAKWLVSCWRTTNLSDIFNKLKAQALTLGSLSFEDISLQELVQEVIPNTGHEHIPEYWDMEVDA